MLQKTTQTGNDMDMFRNELVNIINIRHKLVILSKLVDWTGLEAKFSVNYSSNGRAGMPIRLMSGLLMLKEIEKLSDEKICEFWIENPYYQYFCGYDNFVSKENKVMDASLLTKRRNKLGKKYFLKFEEEILDILKKHKLIKGKELLLDATVFESKISYPNDVKLLNVVRDYAVRQIVKKKISNR